MEAKEKGDVFDSEAEAFLADVECTATLMINPQALTTTNMFQANHEDAYDSDVDEGPNAAVAFMANLSSTRDAPGRTFRLRSETEIDDNTIPYHQYLLDTEAQNVPTEVSADTSDKVSMIAILTDLQTQLDGHAKLRKQLQGKDDTIRNLDAQINIMKVLNVGSTEGSCDQQALETTVREFQTKPATESRKPMPKSHTRNHRILPSKSVKARSAADHNRKLNVVDHNQFVIRSLTSVQTSSGLAPQQMTSVPNSTELELTAL
ncbi:hypothetical protein Tco_0663471 [Tanacetum coccineum]